MTNLILPSFKHIKTFNKLMSIAVVSSGIALTSTANAATIEASNASYKFSVNNKYNGTATRKLTQNGNNWRYDVSARVYGVASANQHTSFSLSGNKVIPSSASTSYRLFGVGNTHQIRFNRNSAVSTYKGQSHTISMPTQAYDDLSLEVQIRQELLNGQFSGSYHLVKRDSIERTPFRKVGNASITVPAGTFNTVRIDRVHDDSSRRTTFWLAPSLDYLPIKVIQNNDGKRMQLELTSVN